MNFQEIIKLLDEYHIKMADCQIVRKKSEAVAASEKLDYPVAIKVISSEIIHKTDKGCLKLDLKSKDDVEAAFDEITKNAVNAKIDGYILQKMAKSGLELLVGGKKDPVFGQVIVFGIGGIFVEVFNDVSMRICPIQKSDAEEMLNEIRGHALLYGVRGKKPIDVKALTTLLVNVSKMLDEHQEITELDLNPVIAYPDGYLAVDARVL